MNDYKEPSASDHDESGHYRQALNESARLLNANRPSEAARILEPLYKSYPHDPDVAINLGGAFILQRKWKRASDLLKKATERHPQNVMLWVNLAAALLGTLQTAGPKQQQSAIVAYERALALDPKAPNVHYHLGLIYKEQGNLKQAVAHFQRAVEVNPGDQDARQWLSRIEQIQREIQRQQDENAAEDADQ